MAAALLGGVALATLVAVGIGVHNFGEGLAIGTSFAFGELTLGSFLIVGFMIHNVTEGLGIAAPAAEEQVSPVVARLGGARPDRRRRRRSSAPGRGLRANDLLAVLFFARRRRRRLEVVTEVGRYVRGAPAGAALRLAVAGFLAGIAVMYVTGLLAG